MALSAALIRRRRRLPSALSGAAALLNTWADSNGGLAAVFTDITSSQPYGSMKIIDGATPANNWQTTTSLTPFDKLTWTGASLRMCYGSDGVLRYANHNVVPYSEDQNSRTKTNCTVTSNVATAPGFSSATVDRITANAGAGFHYCSHGSTNVAAGSTVKCTWRVKQDTATWAFFTIEDASINYVNLATGATGTCPDTVVVTAAGDGYYDVVMTRTVTATVVNGSVGPANGNNAASFTAAGTEAVLVAYVDAKVQPCHSTDYIATTSSAVYKPRIDWDPSTLAVRGLLVEEARTNSLLYSNAITTSPWVVGEFTYSSPVTGADGTTNLNKMIESTTASAFHFARQTVNTSAATYTSSAIVKAAERRIALVAQDSAGTNQAIVVFDVSGAQVGPSSTTGTGFSVSGTPTITSIGGGLYRVVASFTVPSSATNQFLYLLDNGTGTGAASLQYTGNGTSGVYLGYCQVELGAFATSYIPTTSASVTRAADVIDILTSLFNLNASAGTMYVSAEPIGLTQNSRSLLTLHDNTGGEIIQIVKNTSARELAITDGSVGQCNISNTLTDGASGKTAAAWAANDAACCTNGGTVGTDASVTLPTVTTLNIGSNRADTAHHNAWYKQVMHLPQRLASASLQTLTT